MANLNRAPRMGETDDDDSNESSDLQPVFLDAAFEADKRAKERALQEENQRRILEFLNIGSEDEDEEDEADAKITVGTSDSKSEADQIDKTETESATEAVAIEQSVTADGEAQVDVDPLAGQSVEVPAAEAEPGDEGDEILQPEYDMASEATADPVSVPSTEAEPYSLPLEEQPDVPDIEPTVAAAKVESLFDREWAPNQGEATAALDPDSKAEVFEQTAMDEEPLESEVLPTPETDINTPPPPPEDPPTDNFDSFDTPPPPPDVGPEVEAEFGQPPEQPPAEQVNETHREVVDHYRGGVGAALLAFFAANWLSRRRDRKLKREAQKLEKEFRESQKLAQAERSQLRAKQRKAETQHQDQLEKLSRLEREHKQQTVDAEKAAESIETRQAPVPVAEVLAAAAYAKEQETASATAADALDDREQANQPKDTGIETARESSNEIDYERQKEALAGSALQSSDINVAGRNTSGQSALDAAEASLNRRNERDDSIYNLSMPEASTDDPDLYHKSIAAGAAVGVAVVVLVAVFYFFIF